MNSNRDNTAQEYASKESAPLIPLVVGDHNRAVAGIWGGLFFIGLYLFSNHYHYYPPQQLPMSRLDELTPFTPWTIWIYAIAYPLVVLPYLILKERANYNRYFYSVLITCAISVTCFWLYPTTYPRADYPLPADPTTWSEYFFTAFRWLDSPASCAPSLHVSTAFLTAFAFREEQKKKFPLFLVLAIAIWISTATTKQHYWIDGFLGLALAWAVRSGLKKVLP